MLEEPLDLFLGHEGALIMRVKLQSLFDVFQCHFVIFDFLASQCSPAEGLEEQIFVFSLLFKDLHIVDDVGTVLNSLSVSLELDEGQGPIRVNSLKVLDLSIHWGTN